MLRSFDRAFFDRAEASLSLDGSLYDLVASARLALFRILVVLRVVLSRESQSIRVTSRLVRMAFKPSIRIAVIEHSLF